MGLTNEQIKELLGWFMNESNLMKTWEEKRKKGIEENHKWIQPDVIKAMPDDELKVRYLKYFNSNVGDKQNLIKIQRDRIIRDVTQFRKTIYYLLDESIDIKERINEILNGGHKINGFGRGILTAFLSDFNHMEAKHKDARITEDTIQEIDEAVGSRVGNRVFIIAPALTFDFQQDYIDFDKVRYYALRIPYSIIHELHRREFTALKQPSDEMAVNDTVEAVGFDFIRTPELKYRTGTEKVRGELFEYGFIKIDTFKSDAVVREPFKKKSNLETLSMVMFDFDYDEKTKVFDLDEIHYASDIEKEGWKVRFLKDRIGKRMMAAFLDIYGNEARVLIDAVQFGRGTGNDVQKKNRKKE